MDISPRVEERTEALAQVHDEYFAKPNDRRRHEYSRGDGHNGHGSNENGAAASLSDDEVISIAKQASNCAKFERLWNGDTSEYDGDDSRADQALCCILAFYTRDSAQIDRIFQSSRLYREKWDERHFADGRTYGHATVERALELTLTNHIRRRPRADRTRRRDAGGSGEQVGSSTETSQSQQLILDPADPLPSARAFAEEFHTVRGTLALRHQGGGFYAHDAAVSAYQEQDEATVRARVYKFLENARCWNEPNPRQKPKLGPFKPTKNKVENVLDALRAICNMPASCPAPCWIQDNPGLDPFEILACRNGLLHIRTRKLLPATPAFFTLNGLEFCFDPRAAKPQNWLRFLQELWEDDFESQDTLQEWFGYTLTPRTHLQKIMMLVGPKRSGKGTIGRVARRLLGERNVCGPTLANMGEQFGLSILIGKSVAIIADARISGRSDTAVVTERLLSISGEDTLSIPRKYLADWTGKLPVRFMLMTNELPRIEDASGALTSRFIVLRLSASFYGCEDHALFDRFVPELPGILNWALEGWDRLYARGRFIQPHSSVELIRQFEELGSPVGTFLRDRCEVGAGYAVSQQTLFETWKRWCEENGRERAGTIQTLGRNVRAVLPWLKVTQPREDGQQVRYWQGLRLRG